MSAKFEDILDGASKYLNNEIIPHMNDWQEILVRIVTGRIFDNRENIKNALINNGIIRTLGIIDESGNVDIEKIASDLKSQISKKSKLSFNIPLLGNIAFEPNDVDKLMSFIPLNNTANSVVISPNNATSSNAVSIGTVDDNTTKKENEESI